MAKIKNNSGTFLKNIFYAFAAQITSLMLSILMSLIVPKLLGTTEFAYWQLYLFYISYVGFFHFGLNDGIYLKLGGKEYEDLDFSLLHSQMVCLLFSQIVIAFVCGVGSVNFTVGGRQFVWIAVGLYLVMFNLSGYFGFVFQAVNNTKTYSLSMIIDKLGFLLLLGGLLIGGVKSFQPFIILHLSSKAVSTLYILIKGRRILTAQCCRPLVCAKEICSNVTIGIKLTIANIASLLILGSGRMVIDYVWGIESFGKLSFSLSLTNFFLLFVSQVSMVLFPALRKVDSSEQKTIYSLTRNVLGLFLPIILLGYYPVKLLLGLWLPQYNDSLIYLGLLLPLCTFDSKMQLLCNTYFKVLREEKKLLQINILAMLFSVVSALIGGFVIENITFIAISMVVAIALRSVIAELYLAKIMGSDVRKNLFLEIVLVIAFMILTWFCDTWIALTGYTALYIVFVYLNKQAVISIYDSIRKYKTSRTKHCQE